MSTSEAVTKAIADYYAIARPTWTDPMIAEGERRLAALVKRVADEDAKGLHETAAQRLAKGEP